MQTRQSRVPSLYVRVYRAAGFGRLNYTGSLTVCEGVSGKGCGDARKNEFPHCM